MPAWLKEISDTFSVWSDFMEFVTGDLFTSVLTDTGTAVAAGVGGILTLTPSDGTVADNDEAYVYSTLAAFKPAAGKPIYLEALAQFTEANTDDANVAVGLASSPAANLIVDDGAGLRASGTVIALYKVDGETVWRFVTRNGSDVTVTQTDVTAGGSAYQKLSIEVLDARSDIVSVVPRIDGALLYDSSSGVRRPIVHTLPLASIAAVNLFGGVKNGGANNQTLLLDYLGAVQGR